MKFIDTTTSNGMKDIQSFLKDFGIDSKLVDLDQHGFSRTIEFKVYDQVFTIVWFINESYLRVGNSNRSATIPFKYIYFDTTAPFVGGCQSLGFSHTKKECVGMFDRPFGDWYTFRIPLEV